MPREVTYILLPLFAGALAILSGILPLQIVGASVIILTLVWPVLGLRDRTSAGDRATATATTQDRTEIGSDDERPTIRKTPHPDPR
ncbi:MAG: hypothetical protein ACRDJW_15175 [Thermomicrobiales bacterium]